MNRHDLKVLAFGAVSLACGGSSRDERDREGDAGSGTSGMTGGTGSPNGGVAGRAGESGGSVATSGSGAGANEAGEGGANATGGGTSATGGTDSVGGATGAAGREVSGSSGAMAVGGSGAGTAGADAGSAGSGAGTGGASAGTAGSGAGTGGAAAGSGGEGGAAGSSSEPPLPNSMGWIGCTLTRNTAEGYARISGTRMWGAYAGTDSSMPNWVNPDSASWGAFDAQVQRFGTPTAVWIQLCPYPTLATAEEVRTIIANTHEHAPGATVYITGIPFYEESPVCRLFVADAPAVVDALAQEAAADASNAVTYPGTFGPLPDEMVAGDACHPNAAGADFLGEQALGYWG